MSPTTRPRSPHRAPLLPLGGALALAALAASGPAALADYTESSAFDEAYTTSSVNLYRVRYPNAAGTAYHYHGSLPFWMNEGVDADNRDETYVANVTGANRTDNRHLVLFLPGQLGIDGEGFSGGQQISTGQAEPDAWMDDYPDGVGSAYQSVSGYSVHRRFMALFGGSGGVKAGMPFNLDETWVGVAFNTRFDWYEYGADDTDIINAFEAWMMSYADEANLQSIYLMGSSRGGCLAYRLAKHISQRSGISSGLKIYIGGNDPVCYYEDDAEDGEVFTSSVTIDNPKSSSAFDYARKSELLDGYYSNESMIRAFNYVGAAPFSGIPFDPVHAFATSGSDLKNHQGFYTQHWVVGSHADMCREWDTPNVGDHLAWLAEQLWYHNPPTELVTGDFDGDGEADLLHTTGAGFWVRWSGEGTVWDSSYENNTDTARAKTAADVLVDDFNGDGEDDVMVGYAVTSGCAQADGGSGPGIRLRIMYGSHNDRDAMWGPYTAGCVADEDFGSGTPSFHRLGSADLTGDGEADLVIFDDRCGTSACTGQGVRYIPHNANSWYPIYTAGDLVITSGVKVRTRDMYQVVDYDGDGDDDLIEIDASADKIYVLKLSGGSAQLSRFALADYDGQQPFTVRMVNMDSDAQAELLWARHQDGGLAYIDWPTGFANATQTHTIDGTYYRSQRFAAEYKIADFDGDGILDVGLADGAHWNIGYRDGVGSGSSIDWDEIGDVTVR